MVVFACEVGSETVGCEGQGHGGEKTDGVGDGDEAAVFLLPVVGRCDDFDGEGVVEC